MTLREVGTVLFPREIVRVIDGDDCVVDALWGIIMDHQDEYAHILDRTVENVMSDLDDIDDNDDEIYSASMVVYLAKEK